MAWSNPFLCEPFKQPAYHHRHHDISIIFVNLGTELMTLLNVCGEFYIYLEIKLKYFKVLESFNPLYVLPLGEF